MISREVAEILLEVKAIIISPDKPFTWVSGIKSPIYTDNRLLISYPEKRKKIVNFFAKIAMETIGINQISSIAGIALGGIPHAAWLAEKLDKPMIFIRSSDKNHGRQNRIEGILNKGDKVLVVEDLISTGNSSINSIKAVKEAGGTVNYCLAIFSYELPGSLDLFERERVKLITLTNFKTLVDVAIEKNILSEKEKEIVLEFAKAPREWASKAGVE